MSELGEVRVSELSAQRLAASQQLALMRLHLWFTGWTHDLLLGVRDDLRALLLGAAGEDGVLDLVEGSVAVVGAASAWTVAWKEWERVFERVRRAAALIPLGTLGRMMGAYLGGLTTDDGRRTTEEGRSAAGRVLVEDGPAIGVGMPENGEDPVLRDFGPVLDAIEARMEGLLGEAASRRYSDGKGLSDRIWNLDRESLREITETIRTGAASGESAWDVAKRLEGHLGPGQECPRWTRGRLYGRTKQQIASGDRTGLISGSPCSSEGVAYNALRLARNEMQIVHHMATDALFAQMPWVEEEQIVLSPSHPLIGCECEEIVVGGRDGEGIYQVGEVVLPVHVQCTCYKVAVLMDNLEFARKARGWMTGGEVWPEMDAFAGWLGVDAQALGALAVSAQALEGLGEWMQMLLWGDEDEVDEGLLGEQNGGVS